MNKFLLVPPAVIVGTLAILYSFHSFNTQEFTQDSLSSEKIGIISSKDNLAIQKASENIDSDGIIHLTVTIENTGVMSITNVHFSMDKMNLLGSPYDQALIVKTLDPGQVAHYDQIVISKVGHPSLGSRIPIVIDGTLQNGTNTIVSTTTVVDKISQ